jgi:hypothetical protein
MIPSLFVHVPSRGKCWICGSPAKPSREHKFKASDIRRHFGKGDLYVGSSDDGYPSGKIAQGVDSTHLKFENPICERCNSSVTQESDSAYDRFIAQMEYDGPDVKEIYRIFSDPRFCKDRSFKSIFRYIGILRNYLAVNLPKLARRFLFTSRGSLQKRLIKTAFG